MSCSKDSSLCIANQKTAISMRTWLLLLPLIFVSLIIVGCASTESGVGQSDLDDWTPGSENVSSIQPVTSADEVDRQPKYAGNGEVYFASNRDGAFDVWITSLSGTGGSQQLTTSRGADIVPSPHPNGEDFFFISERRADPEVFMGNRNRSTATAISRVSTPEFGGFASPEISPDGSQVLYVSGRHIWVYDVDSGTRTQMVTGHHPSWHPNGEQIFFIRKAGEVGSNRITTSIWVMDADGGNRTELISSGTDATYRHPVVSPNGERIAYTRSELLDEDTGRATNQNIWFSNTDGSGATQITTNPFTDTEPSWVSNTQIAFASNRPESDSIEDVAWNVWLLTIDN